MSRILTRVGGRTTRLAGRFALVALVVASCSGTLDAGKDVPHGLLPVDERNPVIIYNDSSSDNWMGEYSVLLAASGGPPLAGLIVTASSYWPDLNGNTTGWASLLSAAASSGLEDLPAVTSSAGKPLVRPSDGVVDDTAPNDSAGAQLIVSLSRQLGRPQRPVVVLAGTQLTDVADAYLIDHTVVERVVVVAALGSFAAPNGAMGAPNGELDPWADWIVAQQFQYVQVSTFYDQTSDVTTSEVGSLPGDALGAEMAAKQPNLFAVTTASDQVSVLAVALNKPVSFATAVERAVPDTSAAFDSTQGPPLTPSANGNVWIVTQIAAPLAGARLWEMLLDRPGAAGGRGTVPDGGAGTGAHPG
ncbi:MAG TPA: hypothetical protein VHG72_20760 [Polyangia bacterium]|nr:hypothetical protein [Polyangia bacterium]HVZ89405.1 hypothetical protein [Polyangia bacterium]